jgi:hypothetical protein
MSIHSRFALGLALAGLLVASALPAQTTWTVDITLDENDGACVATDCSLREALAGAAGGDTIQFALPGSPPWVIRLDDGLGPLVVPLAVTVDGPGAASLTITGDSDTDGVGEVRTIEVTASGALTLSDVRLELGLATSSGTKEGGCLRNLGTATLTGVELVSCRAWSGGTTQATGQTGGAGGAIWNAVGATLVLDACRFVDNRAGRGACSPDCFAPGPEGGSGGAIANAGTAEIVDSTFEGNHGGLGGTPSGRGGDGGAIANLATGVLWLRGSTLASNFSGDETCQLGSSFNDGRGGGMFSIGETSIENSTLSDNQIGDTLACSSQNARGGGLAVAGGTTRLRNATVAANTASGNGGGIAREGGTLRLRNSLVAENVGSGSHDDCTTTADASLISEGYNAVGARDGCVASLTATGDQTGTAAAPLDTGIGVLAGNGGATQTHALEAASVAIDAGDPAGCLGWDPVSAIDVAMPTDQRGETRPTDGDGDLVDVCDSGSYEAPAAPPAENDLTVAVAGSGTGSVSSSPPGIACPGDCVESYVFTETVDLTPAADPGSMFTGWSGDCAGSGACAVEMSADRSVTATFTALRTLAVSLAGDGSGTVESDDLLIDCPGDCGEVYLHGATPTLSATPAPGSIFLGWSGDCAGTGTCPLAMTADRNVTATFLDPEVLTVTLLGDGAGQVTSDIPGIVCPGDCQEAFTGGETVELSAAASPGSFFAGWGGDCSGTATPCTLAMSTDRPVTASFLLVEVFADGFESGDVCLWDGGVGAPPC